MKLQRRTYRKLIKHTLQMDLTSQMTSFFCFFTSIHLTTLLLFDMLYTGDNNAKKRIIRTRQRNNGIRI